MCTCSQLAILYLLLMFNTSSVLNDDGFKIRDISKVQLYMCSKNHSLIKILYMIFYIYFKYTIQICIITQSFIHGTSLPLRR